MYRSIMAALAVLFFSSAALADLTVAYPPDNVTVNKATLSIVGTSDETGSITVNVKGGSAIKESVPIELGASAQSSS